MYVVMSRGVLGVRAPQVIDSFVLVAKKKVRQVQKGACRYVVMPWDVQSAGVPTTD